MDIYIFGYLPPANEVCEAYVFTGVCLSMGGVSATQPPGPKADLGRHPWADSPQADTLRVDSPQADTPWAVHAGIRSTSGWYASHWNAFLF